MGFVRSDLSVRVSETVICVWSGQGEKAERKWRVKTYISLLSLYLLSENMAFLVPVFQDLFTDMTLSLFVEFDRMIERSGF